jgi:hypothetical protein
LGEEPGFSDRSFIAVAEKWFGEIVLALYADDDAP